ncbi:urease accessory protein [Spinactinospora alkalitolerans]|uniref:Urease accessory protein UreF n=1 Tax=Spinactinospora alkalitolerans TaxID=687207 RepID=A0A852U1L4_9ACTN|nr:urease accessory UreF family protein [Spinactinospora alkalitolerans]NYE47880.1 urease accessory protein [Spinactinospora alkalitolerans]
MAPDPARSDDRPIDGGQPTPPALLLLADGRFPSGGHAHSGGLEAAAGMEGVHGIAALELFLRGRLDTVGVVAAAFAAAACAAFREAVSRSDTTAGLDGDSRQSGPADTRTTIEQLDLEFDARCPSPVLRTTSRRLGRQLLRAGRAAWPHPVLDAPASSPGRGPHQPVALGAVAAAARLQPDAAALAAAHDAVTGPATAAVRLLSLNPFTVHAVLARLGSQVHAVAADGARYAGTAPADLPARAGPLLDVSAEHHATWEVRLFAS